MEKSFDNYRLDNKVVLTSLILCVFFLVLIGFRLIGTKKCPEKIDFTYQQENNSELIYANEKVDFSSLADNAEKWEWNFGDNTPIDKKSGGFVTHQFVEPGVYTVRLTINNKCPNFKNISINRLKRSKPTWVLRPVWPVGPLIAGQRYNFVDSTSEANSWTWYFDGDVITRKERNVQKVFGEPGEYKVILVINNDAENGTISKKFIVTAPPAPVPRPITNNNGNNNTGNNNTQGNRNPNIKIDDNPIIDQKEVVTPVPPPENFLKKTTITVPELDEADLRILILDINGAGYDELKKKYIKPGDIKSCKIIFNDNAISFDELKENIEYHKRKDNKNVKYGKSLKADQKLDDKGYIIRITITAELNQPKGLIGSFEKKKAYPH
jgi:PKD repeat protein